MPDTTTTTVIPSGESVGQLAQTWEIKWSGQPVISWIRPVVCSEGRDCPHQSVEI
jgi:hypothetical protein